MVTPVICFEPVVKEDHTEKGEETVVPRHHLVTLWNRPKSVRRASNAAKESLSQEKESLAINLEMNQGSNVGRQRDSEIPRSSLEHRMERGQPLSPAHVRDPVCGGNASGHFCHGKVLAPAHDNRISPRRPNRCVPQQPDAPGVSNVHAAQPEYCKLPGDIGRIGGAS